MPDFECRVISASGEVSESIRSSPGKESLYQELRKEGYLVLRLKAKKEGRFFALRSRRGTTRELRNFTDEMAVLLGSGFTLEVSISILRESVSPRMSEMLDRIYAGIKEGQSLGQALEGCDGYFSDFYVGMVKAGEEGGNLPQVFKELADYLEGAVKIRSEILSAIIYPAILFVVGLLSILVFVVFIVPRFSTIFSEMNVSVPPAIRILAGLSDFTLSFGWIGLGLGIAGFLFFKVRLKDPLFRLALDRKKLKAPVIGSLLLEREVGRFARGLGALLGGGVELLRAIDIMAFMLPNAYFRAMMENLKREISEGGYLSAALRNSSVIPGKYLRMIGVGEHSGKLNEMLLRVADISERELNEKIRRAVGLIEPAIILVMGVLIGTVVISMLLGIMKISDVPF